MLPTLRRRRGPRASRDAVLRDVREPRHLPPGLDGRDPAQHAVGHRADCRRSTTTSGSSTRPTTGPRRTTWRPSSPSGSPTSSGCSSSRPRGTTSCRSTIAGSSASTPIWPAGRTLIRGNRQLLFGGMGRLTENSVLNIKNKCHAVTAQVIVPEGGAATGVIVAQGGAFGGWALYALDGRPAYCYNLFGLRQFKVYGDAVIPAGRAPGPHGVRLRRWRARRRAARSRCSSTAPRSARVASMPRCR